MVPRLSHGNVPERGRGRKEMPFWLKEREKNDDVLMLIWVTHPGYTQAFLQGHFSSF